MTDPNRNTETTDTAEAVKDAEEAQTEAQIEADESSEPTVSRRRGRPRLPRNVKLNLKVVPVILVLLLLISGGAATWVYFKRYQPNQRTDPSVARAVVSAASD